MKVAFVNQPHLISTLPPGDCLALEATTHEVARRLTGSCDVLVYSLRGTLPEEEWCEGVQYRRISDPGRWDNAIREIQTFKGGWQATRGIQTGLYDFRSWLYYLGYSFGVAKDLRHQHCDVVHVVNQSQWLPIIRALNPGIKTVLRMHCEWLTRLDPTAIEGRLKKTDRILGCSEFVTNQIRDAFPRYADKCSTVYQGVDVVRFIPSGTQPPNRNGTKRILSAGRMSPEKGFHVLLDAFAMVVKQLPEARLEIVGGGPGQLPFDMLADTYDPSEVARLARFYDGRPYLTHLIEQTRSLGLMNHVIFSGRQPHSQMQDSYRGADLFVLPTTGREPLGKVILEAMAMGIPVVATRAGGVSESVQDGRTGILVEPNRPAELAEAILQLLHNPNLAWQMAQLGRERAARCFSWEKVAEDLLHVYGSLAPQTERRMSPVTVRPGESVQSAKCYQRTRRKPDALNGQSHRNEAMREG